MNLSNTFGMSEMEEAAKVFVEVRNRTGSGVVPIENFAHDRHVLTGFSELIFYGWITPYHTCQMDRTKGLWWPTEEFWDRIKSKHPEVLKESSCQ